jgi:hypothetical protein
MKRFWFRLKLGTPHSILIAISNLTSFVHDFLTIRDAFKGAKSAV